MTIIKVNDNNNTSSRKMIVVDLQYREFEEINHLNKNFIPGIKKLKITIDAISSSRVYHKVYPLINNQFNILFPNLKRHLCCYQKLNQGSKLITLKEGSSKSIVNVIHLIEHVIIDIQCQVSKMRICSGITCNYYEPRNRYDIFVECVDERVGYSASQLAIEIVQRILNNDRCILNYPSPQKLQLLPMTTAHTTTPEYDFSAYITNSIFDEYTLAKN